MGATSLIFGVIAIIISLVPYCNYFALVPAILGLVMGCMDVVNKRKNKEPRGLAIAGIVLNAVAILLLFLWAFFSSMLSEDNIDSRNNFLKAAKEQDSKKF